MFLFVPSHFFPPAEFISRDMEIPSLPLLFFPPSLWKLLGGFKCCGVLLPSPSCTGDRVGFPALDEGKNWIKVSITFYRFLTISSEAVKKFNTLELFQQWKYYLHVMIEKKRLVFQTCLNKRFQLRKARLVTIIVIIRAIPIPFITTLVRINSGLSEIKNRTGLS